MKKYGKIALLLLLGLMFFFHVGAEAEGQQQRNLTILVYMCGSNLESNYSSATLDLQEMKESGVGSEKVSFLVLAGGAKRWAAGYDPEKLTLVEIQNGKSRNVRTEIRSTRRTCFWRIVLDKERVFDYNRPIRSDPDIYES